MYPSQKGNFLLEIYNQVYWFHLKDKKGYYLYANEILEDEEEEENKEETILLNIRIFQEGKYAKDGKSL